MFGNLKQLGQLKSLHDQMRSERYTVERDGICVVVTGALSLERVSIADDVPREEIADRVVGVCNEALTKAQRGMAQRLMSSGN